MLSAKTFSRSTIVIRVLAVVLFVGHFAAHYDIYETVKQIPHHVDRTPPLTVAFQAACSPIYFDCLGLWFLAGVFGRMKRGEAFTAAVLTDLKALSLCLIAGGFSGTLIFPAMIAASQGKPFWSLYAGHGIDLIVGLLGLVLLVVSRQGQRLRGELEQFV